MSTRKNKEKGEAAFTTSPFRSLKGLKTKEPRKEPLQPLVSAPEEAGDDAELFLRSVAGARRVHEPREEAVVSAKTPAAKKALPEPDEASGAALFHQAMQSLGAGALRAPAEDDEDAGAAERRPASSRMRQLKKGTLRISGELDLHGFLRDEALRRLDHFIAAASVRGRQAVLVITGKGINSSEGPVLRGAVEERLRTQSGKMVAEFHPAPRDKGGSGAFVVFLKKR